MTQQDREILNRFSERLVSIETAIKGNGTRGLADRMSTSEIWQRTHEEAHQLFLNDLHEYRREREEKERQKEEEVRKRARARNAALYTFAGSSLVSVGVMLLRYFLTRGGQS